jgi:di/tricarboxylate transporter
LKEVAWGCGVLIVDLVVLADGNVVGSTWARLLGFLLAECHGGLSVLDGLSDGLVLLLVHFFAFFVFVFDVLAADGLIKENQDDNTKDSRQSEQGNHDGKVLLLILLFLIVLNLQLSGLADGRAIGFESGTDFELKGSVFSTSGVVLVVFFAWEELCLVQRGHGDEGHWHVLLCLFTEHQALGRQL